MNDKKHKMWWEDLIPEEDQEANERSNREIWNRDKQNNEGEKNKESWLLKFMRGEDEEKS